MNMIEVDSSSLNSFAGLAGQEQPEEQIFVLTSAQLRAIISQAMAPLEARIQDLEDEVRRVGAGEGGEEALQELRERLESLEEATALERAFDRQRIARLERVDPQPLQKDRGEILRALIAAHGGKMLAKEARQKMRMDKATFSRLLDTLGQHIESKPSHHDKRRLVLIIK
jgi:uncharacterized membrane protein